MSLKSVLKKRFPLLAYRFLKFKANWHARTKPENYPKALMRWYKKKTGMVLNLDNPKTYSEKIQWMKLYDSTEMKSFLADKYRVREWIKEKIGEQYLIPLLGVWESPDDIDFDSLPERFVLKANHGSGFNIIVNDKSKINLRKTKKLLKIFLKTKFAFADGFQLHYDKIKPLIIAEKYLENSDGELNDYKFHCFSSEPVFCCFDQARFIDHVRQSYDLGWNLLPWNVGGFKAKNTPVPKPEKFDEMLQLTRILCKDFEFVRVDWYCVEGQIYLGEITFTPSSGLHGPSVPGYINVLDDLINIENLKQK